MNSTTQLHKNASSTFANTKPACVIYLNKEEISSSKTCFDDLLLEAVESAFSSLLGDSNKQALYYSLSASFGISRETIPRNVEGFADALEQIFGQGALLLEARIMQVLHGKASGIKVFPEQGEVSFAGYVESIRRFFQVSAVSEAF
jgi:hypothetical protein